MAEMRDRFNVFVYGTLRKGQEANHKLAGAEYVGDAHVTGILYNIDDKFPALVLYVGAARVDGEIWRCPIDMLSELDTYEGVSDGLFRRVGVQAKRNDTIEDVPAWTYVAGPLLSQTLTPERRIN